MCLNSVSEKQIAKEDIVCYKVIKNGKKVSSDVKDGDSFTGIIYGNKCEGKISIENNKHYFCTNNEHLDGLECCNKHGYKYSWVLSNAVTSIIINGKECIENSYVSYYQEAEIEIGKTYTSEIEFDCNTIEKALFDDNRIEKALHSYADLGDVIEYYGNVIIVKCIIPKNAIYYIGEFNGYKSYASNELKYVEIVKNKTV